MAGSRKNWQRFGVQEQDPEETRTHKWLPLAGAGVLVLVLGGAGAGLVSMMGGTAAPQQPQFQQVSIVLPPPPPPKMEEPPPPEEVELDEALPEPMADDSGPADAGSELGLDADGVAGSDAFGLRAKRGGRGLLGGGGDEHKWYAGVLQRELQSLLASDESIRGLGDYAVIVSIRLGDDGRIKDSQLLSGSNNPLLDAALRNALSAGVQISRQPPPDDLPQPVRLRITSRS